MGRCRSVSRSLLTVAALLWTACAGGAPVPQPPVPVTQDSPARALYDEAVVLVQAGDDAAAVPKLKLAVQRDPTLLAAHLLFQDTALALAGPIEADMRAHYDALPPGAPLELRYARGRLLQTRYEKMQVLEAILAERPDFAPAHLSMGRLLRSASRYQEAVEAFRRALAASQPPLLAYVELAETLVELGEHEPAAIYFANYLRGVPNDDAAALAYVELTIYRLGRPADALPWLDRLLERNPDDTALLLHRGAALWRGGQLREALAVYGRVLALDPHEMRALLNVAALCYDAMPRQGDAARQRARWWPLAWQASQLYSRLARPVDGAELFELYFAVPFRIELIERELQAGLPPPPGDVPALLAELDRLLAT